MRPNRMRSLHRILCCCSLIATSLVLTSCGVAAGSGGTPPAVISNPGDQTILAGSNATFTAAASGSPAPSVQWQASADGGVTFGNLSGATSTTMSFSTTMTQSGNRYRAVFSNSAGSAASTAALLTVNPAPPVITTSPSNQTIAAGNFVSFTAAASGSPAPTVQWQASTDGGATFSNLTGATSTNLFFSTTVAQNGNFYRAVFTNVAGSATTATALLTVNTAPPAITASPSNQTIAAGNSVNFTAAASGSPTPTVQWQVSTDGGATFNNLSGATSTFMSFVATVAQNGNRYRAVFTNVAGSATSAAALLTVNTAPPAITASPSNQTIAAGNSVNFTAAASGSPAPTVQWQVSTDGGATFSNLTGATSTNLFFSTTVAQNGNFYRAVFTNVAGSATTATALLTVNTAPPVITASPSNQTIAAGNFVSFNAAASGSPTPTVQWQASTDGGATFSNLTGATFTTLNFLTTAAQNGNHYRAVFTNVAGSATSAAALLTVNTAPPVITISPSNQTIGAGNFVSFTAAASGAPAPTVQWQASTDGGATFSNLSGATSTFLGFPATLAQNGNLYRALFTNTLGSATSGAALLTVDIAPTITASPTSQTIFEGNAVTFSAAASGSPTPTVQWQASTTSTTSTNGCGAFSSLTGATSATLTFSTTAAQNGNCYRAVFTNAVGSATTLSAVLTVTSPPLVTANPINQTSVAGNPVSFTAAATGSPTPTVQWQASTDGGATFSNLSGATSTVLTFVTTLPQNGNLYRALFTNTLGSVTAGPVVLTVTASSTSNSLLPIADPTGFIQTFTTDPSGQLDTTGSFFQSLGTNGRSCSNCHQQGDAWTISAADVQARFNAATFDANGVSSDPIFQTVDGSTCNQGMNLTTPAGRTSAFTLLTSRGLIRIALPLPANAEFTVQSVSNQYGCGDTTTLSMYRRPLPIANLRFLSQLMWDGRESSALTGTQNITQATNPADLLADLAHQSVDATMIHAQGASAPTSAQQQSIVNFEMQLSVAQAIDSIAGPLDGNGATGGPSAIASQPFSIGVNDPLGTPPPFNQNVFTPFAPWVNFNTNTTDGSQKAAIARGEIVFNTLKFTVTGVAGLNDVFFNNGPANVTCSFCHNDPNLGNHSVSLPLDIGVANNNILGLFYLPSITLRNNVTGLTITTTDPGVALTTGKWADIGKIKIPILRGLAARAPYFHNGSAQSLQDVLNFYFNRFGVPFSGTDESDLIAFLNSL